MHTAYQQAQLFHRVVHRIRNRPGYVFRHRSFLRQVALRHVLQFVHQSQNRRLVGVVHPLGFLLLVARIALLLLGQLLALAAIEQLHTRNTHATRYDKQPQNHQNCHLACRNTCLARQFLLQVFQLRAQRLAVANDGVLCLTRCHQPLQIAQNRGCLRARLFILFQHGHQLLAHLRVTRSR